MFKNIYSNNENIGRLFDKLISEVKSLNKAPLKKCFKCNEWISKSSFNGKNICNDCDRKEEIERKQYFRKMISKPIILFIYDTSWLMDPKLNEKIKFLDYNVKHIVLDGVKNEINNHINGDNEEKKIDGGKARRIVSEIMSEKGFIEYNEKEIPELNISEKILGPDSKVDKQIISLAKINADVLTEDLKTNLTFAYIYTHDGGIKTEAITLFNKYKKLIFTSSSIKIFNELLYKIEYIVNEKSNNLAMSN